jgi:hypothetical protein
MATDERSAILRRAQELEDRHEDRLHDLGRLALDMHRRDELDSELLMARAEEIARIEKDLGRLHIALEQDEGSSPKS